ncbi:MAG: signal peptidase II [Anaerolineae bacterium]|nr:signal peptidase II [Anaerolineae bacterium]
MKRIRLELWIMPSAAALVLIADQITKYLVATQLEVGQSVNLIPWLAPVFSITHVTNTGVAFGMLQGLGSLFAIAHVVAAVVIILYSRRLPPKQWTLQIALGLALGGSIGNLIDRVRQGYVVDFFDVNFWPLQDFPVWNVADNSIVVGVALMIGLLMWEERQERLKQQAAEGA